MCSHCAAFSLCQSRLPCPTRCPQPLAWTLFRCSSGFSCPHSPLLDHGPPTEDFRILCTDSYSLLPGPSWSCAPKCSPHAPVPQGPQGLGTELGCVDSVAFAVRDGARCREGAGLGRRPRAGGRFPLHGDISGGGLCGIQEITIPFCPSGLL